MIEVNKNRYICGIVKSGVSDFKRFSTSLVSYLFRDENGNISLKRSDGLDMSVGFVDGIEKLNREFYSEKMSYYERSDNDPSVVVLGSNPYTFYENNLNTAYYAYFDSGIWKSIGYDSTISGVFPSYTILLTVASGDMFFVFQEGENVTIYKIGTSSIEKKNTMSGFKLLEAIPYGNNIIVIVSKIGISYPSQIIDELLIGEKYEYFKGSPSAFVCLASSSYTSFRSFCYSRSIFPIMCKDEVKLNSFVLVDTTLYAMTCGYNPTLGNFIPIVALGKDSDQWRFLKDSSPFGELTDIDKIDICVDSDDVIYTSCKKEGNIYLTYYNRTDNRWVDFDSTSTITFDNAESSSCSSSSCSNSSSSSSYSLSSSSYSSSSSSYSSSSSSSSRSSSSSSSTMPIPWHCIERLPCYGACSLPSGCTSGDWMHRTWRCEAFYGDGGYPRCVYIGGQWYYEYNVDYIYGGPYTDESHCEMWCGVPV